MDLFKPNSENPDSEPESSQSSISDFLKTMREPILVVGRDLRIIVANDAATGVFENSGHSIVEKRLSEVLRDVSIHKAFSAALSKNKSKQVRIELLGIDKRSFDVSVSPLDLGDTKFAVGVFYDVTQIEHLEKVRQEFLSNISHELRSPLTSILAFIETLEAGGIDDKKNSRRFLAIIRNNAKRMSLLINDISELSSIEAGKIKIKQKKIRPAALVNRIFETFSSEAEEASITLINEIKKKQVVVADVLRLEQMLTNLIDNAIKFNFENGSVTVKLSSDDSYNYIYVSDTGEGIPREHLPRVFERLFRSDRARSREVGGTGLGLAIVKHLARSHGGDVSVESELGKGSTFTISLPVKKS